LAAIEIVGPVACQQRPAAHDGRPLNHSPSLIVGVYHKAQGVFIIIDSSNRRGNISGG